MPSLLFSRREHLESALGISYTFMLYRHVHVDASSAQRAMWVPAWFQHPLTQPIVCSSLIDTPLPRSLLITASLAMPRNESRHVDQIPMKRAVPMCAGVGFIGCAVIAFHQRKKLTSVEWTRASSSVLARSCTQAGCAGLGISSATARPSWMHRPA